MPMIYIAMTPLRVRAQKGRDALVRLLIIAAFSWQLITHAAVIRTFAGTGTKGFSGDGNLATQAQLSDPAGIARSPDGALYICDTANHRIRKVTADGKI